MTEKSGANDAPISEAAKAKAIVLLCEAGFGYRHPQHTENQPVITIARFIQQVSDAAKGAVDFADYTREAGYRHEAHETLKSNLSPFILSEPVDPLANLGRGRVTTSGGHLDVDLLIGILRGLKIVEER